MDKREQIYKICIKITGDQPTSDLLTQEILDLFLTPFEIERDCDCVIYPQTNPPMPEMMIRKGFRPNTKPIPDADCKDCKGTGKQSRPPKWGTNQEVVK